MTPELPAKPYLKPWYRLASGQGRLVLEYAHSAVVLEGKAVQKLLPVLLPLLDGTRTPDEISEQIGETVRPAVLNAIAMLTERGLLTDGPPIPADAALGAAETAQLLAALSGDGRTPAECRAGLEGARASMLGSGSVAEQIAALLTDSGVLEPRVLEWPRSAEDLGALDLAIVAPEPGELAKLEAWNRLALEAGTPWLQVLPYDGRIAAIGPLYVPGDSCCYECYRRRRAAILDPAGDAGPAEESPGPPPPALQEMIAGLAAMLALRWLGEPDARENPSTLPGTLHALEWAPQVGLSEHHVYRVPRCPVCFPDDQGTALPWHD